MDREADAKKGYLVRVRCTVIKSLLCEDCSEDELRKNPFAFSIDETDIDFIDWEIEDLGRVDL